MLPTDAVYIQISHQNYAVQDELWVPPAIFLAQQHNNVAECTALGIFLLWQHDIIIIIIIWTLQYEHEMYDKFGVKEYQYIMW